jgi:hypothetical protein
MATLWPDRPCPYCGQTITDLLLELVPDAQQTSGDYRAIMLRRAGGAVTCPYCEQAVEYDPNGQDLVKSTRMRYSRVKTTDRARNYGRVFLNQADTTAEEWVAHDKGMPGALRDYRYAEDP